MTEREDSMLENLASATEFTGMLPAIASEDNPDLAAMTDVPAPVCENPAQSPLLRISDKRQKKGSRCR